jgi:membrane protease YdiL (CAAX protease family)
VQPLPSSREAEPVGAHQRRLVVSVVTLIVGTSLLGVSLRSPAGSGQFYVTAAALAAVWLVGGLLAGPQQLGGWSPREIAWPILLGAVAFGVFALGALIVSGIGPLHDAVNDVVRRADQGSRALVVAITIVNGIAEEVFFRGAFYRLLNPRTAALWTTVCYVVVTAAAGNLMLVLAAALMGTVWALERRATGGILASALTHVTWSVLVIFLLPR